MLAGTFDVAVNGTATEAFGVVDKFGGGAVVVFVDTFDFLEVTCQGAVVLGCRLLVLVARGAFYQNHFV